MGRKYDPLVWLGAKIVAWLPLVTTRLRFRERRFNTNQAVGLGAYCRGRIITVRIWG